MPLTLLLLFSSSSYFLFYLVISTTTITNHNRNANNEIPKTLPRSVAAYEEKWVIKPVIGILAQEAIDVFENAPDKSYIPAAYVKYVESAGGVALPIRLNRSDEYYKKIYDNIHGLILPGGEVSLDDSEYARLSKLFFGWAKQTNDQDDVFPIMGICLGFEQLFYLVAEENPLTRCRGLNYNTNLIPMQGFSKCRMHASMSAQMIHDLTCKNITYNAHQFCVEPEVFNSSESLKSFFRIGALSRDLDGILYIAYAEARKYPFYGLQWHPERPIFEWTRQGITHSRESIRNGLHYITQFIDEAMKSKHDFREKYFDLLIFNHQPVFTGSESPFMQTYFFRDFDKNKDY